MLMTKTPQQENRSLEDYLTIGEAMALSGYTEQYLRRLSKAGRLQALKRGHFWLIERASLEAYVEAALHTEDQRFGPREEEA